MTNTSFVPHPKKNKYNEHITLGPRPKHKDLANKRIAAESVLCLLKQEEMTTTNGDFDMGGIAIDAGYTWINIPSDARPWSSDVSTPEHWLYVASELEELLGYGKVYVHCAAGIHRTGLAAYSWYREYGGVDTHKEAFYYIVKHRPVIKTDIGNKILVMREYFDRKDQ